MHLHLLVIRWGRRDRTCVKRMPHYFLLVFSKSVIKTHRVGLKYFVITNRTAYGGKFIAALGLVQWLSLSTANSICVLALLMYSHEWKEG